MAGEPRPGRHLCNVYYITLLSTPPFFARASRHAASILSSFSIRPRISARQEPQFVPAPVFSPAAAASRAPSAMAARIAPERTPMQAQTMRPSPFTPPSAARPASRARRSSAPRVSAARRPTSQSRGGSRPLRVSIRQSARRPSRILARGSAPPATSHISIRSHAASGGGARVSMSGGVSSAARPASS